MLFFFVICFLFYFFKALPERAATLGCTRSPPGRTLALAGKGLWKGGRGREENLWKK